MVAYEKYEKTFTADEIADALVSMGQTSVPDEWRYLDNVRVRLVPVEKGQRDPELVGVRVVWWLDGEPQPVKPSPVESDTRSRPRDTGGSSP